MHFFKTSGAIKNIVEGTLKAISLVKNTWWERSYEATSGGVSLPNPRQALPEAFDFEVDACQLEFSGEKFSFLTGTLFGESVVVAQRFGLGALACSFSKVRFSYCTELLEIGPA